MSYHNPGRGGRRGHLASQSAHDYQSSRVSFEQAARNSGSGLQFTHIEGGAAADSKQDITQVDLGGTAIEIPGFLPGPLRLERG